VEALSESEKQQLEALKQRDQEVRAHERAHLSAAGGHAVSGANFTYQTGPDGKRYAVGGEVSIDISPESSPEATLQKALIIQRAALAPAEPSTQDRRIAMEAEAMAVEARGDIREQQLTEAEETSQEQSDEEEKQPGLREQKAIDTFVGVERASMQVVPENFEYVV
jgi:hypothetical protein